MVPKPKEVGVQWQWTLVLNTLLLITLSLILSSIQHWSAGAAAAKKHIPHTASVCLLITGVQTVHLLNSLNNLTFTMLNTFKHNMQIQ